jgi:hypothetical protein
MQKALKSPEVIPEVCHCPTYSESRIESEVTKSPALLPQTLPSGGLARVSGRAAKRGIGSISILRFIPPGGAIDPITFIYSKWRWLKAHHNIEGHRAAVVQRL